MFSTAMKQFSQRIGGVAEEGGVYTKIPLDEGTRMPHDEKRRSRRRTFFPSDNIAKAWCLLTFALGFILGVALVLPLASRITAAAATATAQSPQDTAPRPPSAVIPAEVFYPKIPTAWVPDARYVGFSEFSNSMWHGLVKSSESVWVDQPRRYSLGPGFQAPFDHSSKAVEPPQFYHVSNLHQLHCLNVIRGRYFELQLDLPSLSKQSGLAANDTAYHMDHCIEYLRMTIMCGGSWDVESASPAGTPSELREDPFGHPIGWGGIRDCVNWDALMTWQEGQVGAYKKTWSSS